MPTSLWNSIPTAVWRHPFDQFFDLAEALRHTHGRPVDLVESGTVHNPYLRASIDRSRELVYAS